MSSMLHQGILKPHSHDGLRLILLMPSSLWDGPCQQLTFTDVFAHMAGGSRRGSSGCRGRWKCRRLTGFGRLARRLSSRKRKRSPSPLTTFTALYVTSPSRVRRPLPTMRGLAYPPPLPSLPAYHHHTCPYSPVSSEVYVVLRSYGPDHTRAGTAQQIRKSHTGQQKQQYPMEQPDRSQLTCCNMFCIAVWQFGLAGTADFVWAVRLFLSHLAVSLLKVQTAFHVY